MQKIFLFLAALIFVVLGSVIVFQKLVLVQNGYKLSELRLKAQALKENNRHARAELSRVSSYRFISQQVQHFQLPLIPPGKASVKKP